MKILNYTLKGRRLMLIAHAERRGEEMKPIFDLYNADDPNGCSIIEGMSLCELVDMLTQMRQDIDDLICEYDGGVRDPMLRKFVDTWSHAD